MGDFFFSYLKNLSFANDGRGCISHTAFWFDCHESSGKLMSLGHSCKVISALIVTSLVLQ